MNGEVNGTVHHENGVHENGQEIEDVDERRLNRKAYEYLCRLLEVRTWLIDILKDDKSVAPVIDLEQDFRNGVILARLGNSFAPNVVSIEKIFDKELDKFHSNENTPVYRHSDNIMLWRRAMENAGLPEIFIPETVDVYEGRNMKTVFCLFALATLLHRQRKGPPIRNKAGKAHFSEEELEIMKSMLKDSKLPEFGDVGGILTDRKLKDELAHIEAIREINEAVRKEDPERLLKALQNTSAGIDFVEATLIQEYFESLKSDQAQTEELGPNAIQECICKTNDEVALVKLNNELLEGRHSPESLMRLFDVLQIENAREHVISLYYKLFSQKREENNGKPLTRQQVNEVIEVANALADVKIAAQHGSSEDTLKALSTPCLKLKLDKNNANLYHSSLSSKYKNSLEDFILERDELANIVTSFSNISQDDRNVFELSEALAQGNNDSIEIVLKSICGNVYLEENFEFYVRKLRDDAPKSANQVIESIREINRQVEEAYSNSDLLIRLNECILGGDAPGTRHHLTGVSSSTHLKEMRPELAHRYVNRLLREGAEKKRFQSSEPTWYRYDFPLGSVWTETQMHQRSTKPKTPEAEHMLKLDEIRKVLEEENDLFDDHYNSNEESVKKSQQALRKFLEHRRKKHLAHLERQKHLAATKIQTSYRKYRHTKDTNSLKSSTTPSLSLVRKFVGVLREGEQGADELEIEEAKNRVTQLIHSNCSMDESLRELDEKIALLIRNRVNLEDVIAHKDKIADAAEKMNVRMGSTRKKDRDRVENLEQLFFHLQTEPIHLSNVIEAHYSTPKKSSEANIIKDVLSPIFGYLTEKREQYLFARLLCELLLRDVEKLTPGDDFQTPSVVFISHVFESLADSIDSEENIDLSKELKAFLDEEELVTVFNLNPDEVYKSMYGNDKVTIETALNDEKVKTTVNGSIEFLAKWSERLSIAMLKRNAIPPFLLYLCASLYDMLRVQLPATSSHDIKKLVAEFAYDVYYSHVLTNEKALTKIAGNNKVSDDAKHKLESIIQFIGFAVCNKGYGNDKWYLTSLNKQIRNIHEEFRTNVASGIFEMNVNDIYEMDEFTFYNPSNKPKLCLMQKHVSNVLKYLKANVKIISKDKASRICSLLESCKAPDYEGDRTVLLRLHPIAETPTTTYSNEMFARAKKFIVDLLLSDCKGITVPELLSIKASVESEQLHDEKYNQERMPNIAAKQATTDKVLQELEGSSGKVSKADNYQAIVTDIANDIRLVTRRRRERLEQKRRLAETQRKLCSERDELKKRLALYEEYLETCLQNLGRTNNRKSIRPTEGKPAKVKKERKSSDSNQKYLGSAEKLTKKGILINIAGYPNPKALSKLNVEITSTGKRGVYNINLIDGKENVKNATLDFQDLLRADYSEEDKLVVGETVSLNVPNAIEFFNKKFHNNVK